MSLRIKQARPLRLTLAQGSGNITPSSAVSLAGRAPVLAENVVRREIVLILR
jgi:hypothetical protein